MKLQSIVVSIYTFQLSTKFPILGPALSWSVHQLVHYIPTRKYITLGLCGGATLVLALYWGWCHASVLYHGVLGLVSH